ncbi:AAA family ATPase [Maritimibacter fusiformis]|uniref:AAA family ATPase n=1 Tax=Maritimibacter fusiformis TaxID=2603819 RepID=A0A5D0RNZ5_9RHOB|nr:AAA family ATPase [Maritimibacter fusiformis]TYB82304.1 AAA family ATPase [Maritimibacter fusiformis]
MLNYHTNSAVLAQPDNADNEFLNLVEAAAEAGLIALDLANSVQARTAVGYLSGDALQVEVCAALASGTAPDKALDAIAPLFEPDDVIELRALDPAGGGATAYCGRLDVPGERQALADFIRSHIGQRNLYFGANPRRADLAGGCRAGKTEDVVARRAVVLDFDRHSAPETDPDWSLTLDRLRDLDPRLIVASGNGFHVWLAVEPVTDEALSASVASLAAAMARIGADNMADLPRIARLPWTVNLPTPIKRKRGAIAALALPVPGTGGAPLVEGPAPKVQALCEALWVVAEDLALPGRRSGATSQGGPRASGSPSHYGSGGERKSGAAAPSAELLHLALAQMPNDGPFDDRDDWMRLAFAIKGACSAGGIEAEGRAEWLDWCARWGGGDPDKDAAAWDGITDPGTGWGTVMQILNRVNPGGHALVRDAAATAAFAQQAAVNIQAMSSTPLLPVRPFKSGTLPPRQWLYGRSVIRGFLSLLVAPGGAGKSALAMLEALAMATGRELLPGEKPVRPLKVLFHNAEDGAEEQQRRLAAAMEHHSVSHADLGGRLFLTSGREMPLQLARQGHEGPEIVPGVVDWLVTEAQRLRIDVLVLDPLGAMHTLPENSNEAINLLANALREIAERADVAIVLLHHTSKSAAMDMDMAGAGASRGASALVDAVRLQRHIVRMSAKEAGTFGVPQERRRSYFRVETGKANLSPAEDARWFQMVSVNLGNATLAYPQGDDVQTVERWTPPTAAGATVCDLAVVQVAVKAAIDAGMPPRADPQSKDWIGYLIADKLGLSIGAPEAKDADLADDERAERARVKAMLRSWLRDGGLERFTAQDKHRQGRTCIRVGTAAVLLEPDFSSAADNAPEAT